MSPYAPQQYNGNGSDSYGSDEQDDWSQRYPEVDPSDSASVIDDYQHPKRAPSRSGQRSYPSSQHPTAGYSAYGAVQPHPSTMPSDPSDDYYRSGYAQSAHPHYYHPQSQPGYAQYNAGGRGQVVAYGAGGYPQQPHHQHPFAARGGYYDHHAPRPGYDPATAPPTQHVVPYQQNYFAPAQQGFNMAMQPYVYNAPPPPATEHPAAAPTPPAPAPKDDEAMNELKKQLEELRMEKAAEKERELKRQEEEKIRQQAELDFQKRMEEKRKADEEHQKDLAKAKEDAERAARERLEADRRAKEQAELEQKRAIERIEAETRLKIEKEAREAEEKKKHEAELAAAAEEAYKAKVAAAEAAVAAKVKAEIQAEMEAREAAERKAQEEKEWRKKLEEEARLKAEVEARAKLEEERKAAEAAKAAEEEKQKADKAMRERIIEETKTKIQDDAKKGEKLPIKFKDAVGRKFTFPFHLCQTWQGIEELIKQAFLQVEMIGPHVQEGHYDLIGPDGEIILPSIWEKMVQPDWTVTMHMWPMDKSPPLRNQPPGMHPMMPGMQGRGMPGMPGMPMPGMQGRGVPMGGRGMPMPGNGARPQWVPGMPVPGMPGMGQRMPPGMAHAVPVHPNIVNGDHVRHEKKKATHKAPPPSLFNIFGPKPKTTHKKRTHK